MKQLPGNICPLRCNPCLEDRCAWWDCTAAGCAITSIAESLADVAADLSEGEMRTDGR